MRAARVQILPESFCEAIDFSRKSATMEQLFFYNGL
jgi:hypothetical protein